eukprot:Sro994_g229010.1 n/a (703) ;mRNA; r:10197-12305
MGTSVNVKVDRDNPFRIPPGVSKEVTFAQGASMLLTVATGTNFLIGLEKFTASIGADNHTNQRIIQAIFAIQQLDATRDSVKAATWMWMWKYHLSTFLQLVAGVGMIVVGFIMNMQATSVLGLMLNFAALQFIGEIQDVAFWVAKQGFVSMWVEQTTHLVEMVQLPAPRNLRKDSRFWHPSLIKRAVYAVVTIGLLVGYALLVRQQATGQFLCQNLFVQFGDDFRPELSALSGEYQQHPTQLIAGRVVYYAATSGARFAYCASLQVWTFKGGSFDLQFAQGHDSQVTQVDPENDDPCLFYWAKSQTTETYDLTQTMATPWTVWDMYTNQTHLPIDWMTLFCLDCNAGRTCSNHGTCRANRCDCNWGRFGLHCEYALPCTALELDQRTPPFPHVLNKHGEGRTLPSSSYVLLRDDKGIPVVVYNKPVYVSSPQQQQRTLQQLHHRVMSDDVGNETISLMTAMVEEEEEQVANGLLLSQPQQFDYNDEQEGPIQDLLLFTGRRWGLAQTIDEHGKSTVPTYRSELVRFLRNDRFLAIFSGFDFHMMSSSVDIGTPTDFVTPIEISWYKTRTWLTLAATESNSSNGNLKTRLDLYRYDPTQPLDTVLLCAWCQSAFNPCLNEGFCEGQDDTPQNNDGQDDGGGGQCICKTGFGGYLCEHEQACTDTGASCFQNATCNESTGDCNCPLGYEGRLCQYDEEPLRSEL